MSDPVFRRRDVRELVKAALREDLGRGDPTTEALIPAKTRAKARLIARESGVIAGLPLVSAVFRRVDPRIRVSPRVADGARVSPGDGAAFVTGPLRGILSAERTALNFLGRLSGVATMTRSFVDAASPRLAVLDTRKTTPGWRHLEKYAVRCGGGRNHRLDLADGVMIKDNHLDGMGIADLPERWTRAVRQARRAGKRTTVPLTVEVRTLREVDAALAAGAENLLLDNMPLARTRAAIERVRRHNRALPRGPGGRHVTAEVSGGVTAARIRRLVVMGVDRVSIGALTHSAPALDVALDVERGPES